MLKPNMLSRLAVSLLPRLLLFLSAVPHVILPAMPNFKAHFTFKDTAHMAHTRFSRRSACMWIREELGAPAKANKCTGKMQRAAPHQYTKKLSTLIHALPFSLCQPRKTPSLLGSSSSSLDLPPSSSQLYADDRRRDLPDTTLLASPHRPLAHINNTLPILSPPDRFNVAGRQRSGLHIQRFV